ncbi:MAG: helix-turn-helix domain-containing protein [Planctomycetota bacterium]
MGLARELSGRTTGELTREQHERRYMTELGHRIRTAREERGLTQRTAAEAAGIATDMISRLENGRYTSPGLRTLLRIAEGLGTSIAALLPDVPANQGGVENGLRARLLATAARADLKELELIAEIAATIVAKNRG